MKSVVSKTRRGLVVAGAAGIATLAAPQVLKTRLAQSVVSPAEAQEIPPKTGEVKVQFAHRTGRWGLPRTTNNHGTNTVPIEIHNQFGQGTVPVVHEVQLHVRIDHPAVKRISISLITPDGAEFHVMTGIAGGGNHYCSRKGLDITFVDTEVENCCDTVADNGWKYCPETTASGVERFFDTWRYKRIHGVFHTGKQNGERRLPRINGRPAAGTWYLKVRNHADVDVNNAIRQIDLTVYSRW